MLSWAEKTKFWGYSPGLPTPESAIECKSLKSSNDALLEGIYVGKQKVIVMIIKFQPLLYKAVLQGLSANFLRC